MSDLTAIEKSKLEKILKMDTGYVLDFSDYSFQDFVLSKTHLDIRSEKYNFRSGSKANRLRSFWDQESNYVVGNLISELLKSWKDSKLIKAQEISATEQELHDECVKISTRLKSDSIVEDLDAIQANNNDKDFNQLAKLIRESIEKNEPEAALDRLHTFVVKYIRELCNKHQIAFTDSESLNAVFGKYVRHLVEGKLIQSSMAEKILKFSIQIIEAFNDVRNNKSFAHDNKLLNYHESVLIFNNISSSIKFIDTIEEHIFNTRQSKLAWDEFEF